MAFPFTDDDDQDDAFGQSDEYAFDPNDEYQGEDGEEGEEPEDGEANNRTFMIAAGVLGGIVLLSLICMAAYALVFLPQQRATQATQQAQLAFNNTQVASAFTETAQVMQYTPTELPPTETLTPTNTPVVVEPTVTPTLEADTPDPITATVAAAYTQAALMENTLVPTSTALSTAFAAVTEVPDTGFFDDVGLPGLVIMAAVLFAIIFLARRLRTVPLS